MYWTPCARLMKSITPNTRVSPAAIRNSSTPSCSPLSTWTRKMAVDIEAGQAFSWSSPALRLRGGRAPRSDPLPSALFHRTILGMRIGVVLEHLLHDLG